MGRPRSTRAHERVIDAAVHLIADRGIDATSMDAIADVSGVSKATIYKHWPDKEALCLEAMAHLHGRDEPLADVDTGDLRADLLAVLTHEPPARYADERLRAMPHLMAYAARNPAFGQAWRARVFEPPRVQVTHVLSRAIGAGRLPATLDLDVALALLLGPVIYAQIRKLSSGTTPTHLHTAVVDAFLGRYEGGEGGKAAGGKRARFAPHKRR